MFLDNFLPINIETIWNCKSLVCFESLVRFSTARKTTTFDSIIKINMAEIRQILNTFFFTFYSFPFSSVKCKKRKKKLKIFFFYFTKLFCLHISSDKESNMQASKLFISVRCQCHESGGGGSKSNCQ